MGNSQTARKEPVTATSNAAATKHNGNTTSLPLKSNGTENSSVNKKNVKQKPAKPKKVKIKTSKVKKDKKEKQKEVNGCIPGQNLQSTESKEEEKKKEGSSSSEPDVKEVVIVEKEDQVTNVTPACDENTDCSATENATRDDCSATENTTLEDCSPSSAHDTAAIETAAEDQPASSTEDDIKFDGDCEELGIEKILNEIMLIFDNDHGNTNDNHIIEESCGPTTCSGNNAGEGLQLPDSQTADVASEVNMGEEQSSSVESNAHQLSDNLVEEADTNEQLHVEPKTQDLDNDKSDEADTKEQTTEKQCAEAELQASDEKEEQVGSTVNVEVSSAPVDSASTPECETLNVNEQETQAAASITCQESSLDQLIFSEFNQIYTELHKQTVQDQETRHLLSKQDAKVILTKPNSTCEPLKVPSVSTQEASIKQTATPSSTLQRPPQGSVFLNNDHFFPDALTPSKIPNCFIESYDVPFMDDDAFPEFDEEWFLGESKRVSFFPLNNRALLAKAEELSLCSFEMEKRVVCEVGGPSLFSEPIRMVRKPQRRRGLRRIFGCMSPK